jgi:hypothetical protein
LIALAAAYVIVLQALLLPLSVAAASPFGGSQCTAGTANAPVHPQNQCPCAAGCGMACGDHHALAPAPFIIAAANDHTGAEMPASALTPVVRPARRGPQVPRAPPVP